MQTSVLFMNTLTICTLNLRLLTIKVYISKNRTPLSPAEVLEDPSIYSADSDQTASIGAVWSGSTLYASIFMLTNKQTFFGCSYFAGWLRVNSYELCLRWGVLAQDGSYFRIKPRLIFNYYLCLRLTSPNFPFMRCRCYSTRKVI